MRLTGRRSIADRVHEFGPVARTRLMPDFDRLGCAYPPGRITLIGLKQERRLEVWVAANGTHDRLLRTYPILAASGKAGPKLREGDAQVPEGIYEIESLNPTSAYHLSLRVNYPNAFDRAQALRDGRTNLGGDIMIHGGSRSIGCLAMGDEAAEDLFVLAAETGVENIRVILSPVDFRRQPLSADLGDAHPEWILSLYRTIHDALRPFPGD